MTRKDTILIAVVINAGLLAILFTTAVIYDTDRSNEPIEFVASLEDNKALSAESAPTLIAAVSTGDEVDNVLKYYSPSAVHQPIVGQSQPESYVPELMIPENEEGNELVDIPSPTAPQQEHFIEVTVKRGDVLEKIARANKTSVSAIKRANQLKSEHLSIGQVLKIPVKQHASTYATDARTAIQSGSVKAEVKKAEITAEAKKEPIAAEPVYYVIKSGDNPWKIAKQFGVKYDEILRLNHLDEEKARNLKIGDRVRVK
jgi:LysM repeat protein